MFQVLAKWGEYSNDVQFILQRSPLDPSKSPGSPAPKEAAAKQGALPPAVPGGQPMKKSTTFSGPLPSHQPAIWKSPPGVMSHKPMVSSVSSGRLSDLSRPFPPDTGLTGARLSPDSGRGSDPTGSDTSNFSDQEKARHVRSSQAVSGYTPPGWQVRSARFTSPSPDRQQQDHSLYGYSRPPAYRPPPHVGPSSLLRNSSPADPPPYREPPPPPTTCPTSPSMSRGGPSVRPPAPHYSPPPHHRDIRGIHKGPSPGRSTSHNMRGVSASPSRGQNSPARQVSVGNFRQPDQYWQQSRPPYQVNANNFYQQHLDIFSLVTGLLILTMLYCVWSSSSEYN